MTFAHRIGPAAQGLTCEALVLNDPADPSHGKSRCCKLPAAWYVIEIGGACPRHIHALLDEQWPMKRSDSELPSSDSAGSVPAAVRLAAPVTTVAEPSSSRTTSLCVNCAGACEKGPTGEWWHLDTGLAECDQ